MEVLQRRHNMRVWSGSWNHQAYVTMPITTSLHFGWPSEVQRKCQKMCRQMEECGLMTRKKKKINLVFLTCFLPCSVIVRCCTCFYNSIMLYHHCIFYWISFCTQFIVYRVTRCTSELLVHLVYILLPHLLYDRRIQN